jgi:hypothetical protein
MVRSTILLSNFNNEPVLAIMFNALRRAIDCSEFPAWALDR